MGLARLGEGFRPSLQKRQAEIDERRTMRIPAEEPDEMDLGEAWNVLAERRRDAVIQPPKPPIRAAEAALERLPSEKPKPDTSVVHAGK